LQESVYITPVQVGSSVQACWHSARVEYLVSAEPGGRPSWTPAAVAVRQSPVPTYPQVPIAVGVGAAVGEVVGTMVGAAVGEVVGTMVGAADGAVVGAADGSVARVTAPQYAFA
jgi:hypothetical protein